MDNHKVADSPLNDADFEKRHIWHPYDHASKPASTYKVKSAQGVRLTLDDGTELIDAMSSWWCKIHGYNHPEINSAIKSQVDSLAHVMYGGLSHQPAIDLARQLLSIAPKTMEKVFFSDSGSVSVEVAMKMAIQYHADNENSKNKFATIRSGYHGDTWRTMSVSDPDTGMHHIYKSALPVEHFIPHPPITFNQEWIEDEAINGLQELRNTISKYADSLAALILEPIAQGAGGMYFYHPEYLNRCREICDENNVLLIFDEIATGFGRTGKLFATDHTTIEPDIMCVGKAITGGYLSMAATLCSNKVSNGIADSSIGVFMHGPTFMANPLACSAANASLALLANNNWQEQVSNIGTQLLSELEPAKKLSNVADVRVLGGIGVIEMKSVVSAEKAHPYCKELGVWLRPFGKCIYTMPPYITKPEDLSKISNAMRHLASALV